MHWQAVPLEPRAKTGANWAERQTISWPARAARHNGGKSSDICEWNWLRRYQQRLRLCLRGSCKRDAFAFVFAIFFPFLRKLHFKFPFPHFPSSSFPFPSPFDLRLRFECTLRIYPFQNVKLVIKSSPGGRSQGPREHRASRDFFFFGVRAHPTFVCGALRPTVWRAIVVCRAVGPRLTGQ